MSRRRVVITGMGIVSPLGNTVDTVWQNILAGKSGVSKITLFDASDLSTQIAAQVNDFDPSLAFDAREIRRLDVFVQYAGEACRQAVDDAGIEISDELAPRAGVAIGAGIGGLPYIEKNHDMLYQHGPRKVSPFFIPGAIINMAPGIISMKYNLKGPNISIVSACTTGTHNIGYAARSIMYDEADVMIAGGAEMASTKLGVCGFSAVRALSTRNDEPEKASRPWDKDRDGFLLGEGSGIFVLEELEHAKKRGATIYAELVGFGMSADAYHMTAPDPEGYGFYLTMSNTCKDAKINMDQVNYINAHATSTPVGDEVEAVAIKKTFGEHAYKLATSSTKSMTGHLLGAAGSVEGIFTVLALRDQVAPPTINLDNPSENCDLNFVPHQPQEMQMEYALSNSFGFGGTNGSLLFKRFTD